MMIINTKGKKERKKMKDNERQRKDKRSRDKNGPTQN